MRGKTSSLHTYYRDRLRVSRAEAIRDGRRKLHAHPTRRQYVFQSFLKFFSHTRQSLKLQGIKALQPDHDPTYRGINRADIPTPNDS